MATYIWVNFGSGNGLLPDGTKPLPKPTLTIINEVLWHAPERNFTAIDPADILNSELENYNFEITATPHWGQWVK